MLQQIIAYLRKKNVPVSAAELAEHVFRLRSINAETAERLLSSIIKADSAVTRTADGRWQIRADALRDPPLSTVELVVCRVQPQKVNHWLQWQAIGYAEIKDGKETGSAVHFRLQPNRRTTTRDLTRSLQAAIRFIGNRPVIFDGFGNQISHFRRAAYEVSGLELENPILSLRRLAQRLFPDIVLKEPSQLAALLGLQFLEPEHSPVLLDDLHQAFAELQKLLLQRGIDTLTKVVDFQAGERPPVDFSCYAFDEDFLDSLPEAPGVYVMQNREGEVIYVGKSKNLKSRVGSYFEATEDVDAKLSRIRDELHDMHIHRTGSELEALLLEQKLIEQFDPPINRQLQVRTRRQRQKSRYSRILVLPGAMETFYQVYLLDPSNGLRVIDLAADFSNLSDAHQAVQEHFFAHPSSADVEAKNRLEIAATWLSLNEGTINSIDMRLVTSADEALRLIMEQAKSLSRGEVAVRHY